MLSLSWLRNNPVEASIAVPGGLGLVFIIIAIIAQINVSSAQKAGTIPSKIWTDINVSAYVILGIVFFWLMFFSCYIHGINCLPVISRN
jgi:hypothetical protein